MCMEALTFLLFRNFSGNSSHSGLLVFCLSKMDGNETGKSLGQGRE